MKNHHSKKPKKNHPIKKLLKDYRFLVGVIVFLALVLVGYFYSIANETEPGHTPILTRAVVNAAESFEGHTEFSYLGEKSSWLYYLNAALIIGAISFTVGALISAFKDYNARMELFWYRHFRKDIDFFYLDFDESNRFAVETLVKSVNTENYQPEDKKKVKFLYSGEDVLSLDSVEYNLLKFNRDTVQDDSDVNRVVFSQNNVQTFSADDQESITYSKSALAVRNMIHTEIGELYEYVLQNDTQPKILIIGDFDTLFEELFAQLVIFLQNPNDGKPSFHLLIENGKEYHEEHIQMMYPEITEVANIELINSLPEVKKEISSYDAIYICNFNELKKRSYLNYILQAKKKNQSATSQGLQHIYVYDDGNSDLYQEFYEEDGAIKNIGAPENLYSAATILWDVLDDRPRYVNAAYNLHIDNGIKHFNVSEALKKMGNQEIRNLWFGSESKEPLSKFDKESSRSSADFISNHQRIIKYMETNAKASNCITETLKQVEHKRWNAFNYIQGWTKRSIKEMKKEFKMLVQEQCTDPREARKMSRKSNDILEHICLVPWSELDEVSTSYNALVPGLKKKELEDFKQTDEVIVQYAMELAQQKGSRRSDEEGR